MRLNASLFPLIPNYKCPIRAHNYSKNNKNSNLFNNIMYSRWNFGTVIFMFIQLVGYNVFHWLK